MLTGIEVLDLADEKAAYCTRMLALLGARVIKIEPPAGDPARRKGPFLQGVPERESLPFNANHTNKQGITLNLAAPEGRQLLARLVGRADIVVETFTPEERARWGCDYGELSALNPRLIQAAVTGFGRQGPRSGYRADDLVAAAYGGAMHVTGLPDGPPLRPWGEQSYLAGSLFAALSILLALRRRGKNGQGAYLDLSLQEAMAATLEHVLIRFFHDQTIARRRGPRHWDDAFCILPCRDGFIQMTIFLQWETLVGWMASEGMAGDLEEEPWQDEGYRRAHVERLLEVLAQWTKTHAVNELFHQGQLLGFPWAPVQSPGAVLESAQLKERAFFTPLPDEERGATVLCPGLPFRFSDLRLPALKKAPAPGDDNVRIYRDELGLAEEELNRLAAAGII